MKGVAERSIPNFCSEAHIPILYTRILARVLELQLVDLEILLRGTDLSDNIFLQENAFLTSQQQMRILHNGYVYANDQAIGLKLGKRITPSIYGTIGFLISSSPNLLAALQALQTYLPRSINFLRIETRIHKECVTVNVYLESSVSNDIYRMIHEVVASVLFDSAEFMLGRPLHEGCVYFPYPKPEYVARYSDYIPGRSQFSSPYFKMEMPKEKCYLANAAYRHSSHTHNLNQFELSEFQSSESSGSYQCKIENMMLSRPLRKLSEEEAAASLFISKRTLARRLKSEGTSFRRVRDEMLAKKAVDLLKNNNNSIDTIAGMLNYHDAASFRRAFRRWYDLTPDDYRKQLTLNPRTNPSTGTEEVAG